VIHLDLDDLLHVAARALGHDADVRDYGLLEAAMARPRATAFGRDAYPDLEQKAAALVHSLVGNHALVDGNKRLGLAGLIAFLGVNGRRLTLTNDEAFTFIVDLAEGRLDDVPAIAAVLTAATAPF
jgi:death-on-curing protein